MTPDAPLLQTDYAQALQRKLASPHGLARKHLSMAALYQKRNQDKHLAGKPFAVGVSVWLHNVQQRKGRNPKLDCPWEARIFCVSIVGCSLSQPEECKNQAKNHLFRLIKALLGPFVGQLGSKTATIILERQGKVHQVWLPQLSSKIGILPLLSRVQGPRIPKQSLHLKGRRRMPSCNL